MKRTGDLKLIQELNRSIVLDTIRKSGPISRSEIARNNDLSPTTVTSAVNGLIHEGLVSEKGTGVSSGGRKPILLQFSPNNHYLIGISISNSKITLADMNLEAKVQRKEVYSTKKFTGDQLIAYLMRLLDQFLNKCRAIELCIGISIITQGIVDSKNGVIRHNPKLKLNNVHLKDLVEQTYKLKTWLDNDTNAYILAEKNFGMFNKYENIIYITIGDGIGAGVIVNGSITRGHNGGSGEFGHTSISREGVRCECGNVGCLENYVSWPAFYSRVLSLIARGNATIITDFVNGDISQISPEVFVKAFNAGDELALNVIDEISSYLAIGLVNLVHLYNPEVIILGGEVTNNNPLFIEKVNVLVKERALNILYEDLQIKSTSLGKEFEMVGAASVLLQDKFQFKLTQSLNKGR